MKRVFVTGGAGFIGSHLVSRLLASELERVVVLDNFSSGAEWRLAFVAGDPRLQVIRGDVASLDTVELAMGQADTVFHLASNPDIAKAATDPDIDFRQGTALTRNVVEAMRRQGARRIVYTSGSGVYGEAGGYAFPEDHGPLIPISTYAASKLAGEGLIAAYCHMFDLSAVVLRMANVVGPRQTHGVGYDFVRRLKGDPSRLRILGDGSQSKPYIHVDDAVEAILHCERQAQQRYGCYNVATEDALTVRQIADLAVDVMGLTGVRYEFTGGDRGWKGDVPVVRFDLSRIHALGWRARRNSREAMRAALESLRHELEVGLD